MSTNSISSLSVTALRREPRVDGVLEWSRGEPGNLNIGTSRLTFNDWSIPYDSIYDAVLNKETMFFRKTQTLAIKSDEGEFMFSFHEPIEEVNEIPFQIRITERRSFIGKLFLFGFIMLLVNIAWNLLKAFI
jgi:hypothetical protein